MKIRIGTLISFFLWSISVFAQRETDERVIGFKYILKFDSNNPKIDVKNSNLYDPYNSNYKGIMGSQYANSICDTLGNLLFYYDGTTIYEANGQVMNEGTLHQYNFSNHYTSSLIVPIEESNRRYYYLFETLPHEEDWDYTLNQPKNYTSSCYYPNECAKFWDLCKLTYSIIDMQGNNGKGRIVKKNIFVSDSVAPTLSGIKHQNNIDTWVTVLKYHTNNVLNYKVNSCSIDIPVISVIPEYEYKKKPFYVSYASIYGLGLQFVYSPKGDYIAFPGSKTTNDTLNYLFISQFDNQTGLLDFNSLQTIAVTSGFSFNLFSQDSKYLYYHDTNLFVPVWAFQYNLSTQMSKPFYYNLEKNRATGLDYGKNNDILIFKYKVTIVNTNIYTSYLGQINKIDQPFVTSNLVDSLHQPPFYQPEYVSSVSYIARNNYIYNFYHPDYKKPAAFPVAHSISNSVESPSCFTTPVTLKGNTTIPVDSMYWVVKKSGQPGWQRFNADTFTLTVSPGSYTASLVSYKYCLSDSATQQFIIEDYPTVSLAGDTVYTCESKLVDLPVNTTYTYHWENVYGDVVANQVSETGQYNMIVQNSCGSDKDSLYVSSSILNIANLVTANNDTNNDCWKIKSNNTEEKINVSIYNSWGSAVFSANNYQNNWCPQDESDGIYYYDITYNNACIKKGWVEVMH